MSEVNDNAVDTLCCASCGIAEVDDNKLKECADCDLVRYCSDACQENHTSQHKEACKKRAAELRDELLFKQPDSTHLGDCPICCLPLPLDLSKSNIMTCCSKVICGGCSHANEKREFEERLENRCLFCREPIPDTDEEIDKNRMKRVEANDPVAMCEEGYNQGKKGDYRRKRNEMNDPVAIFQGEGEQYNNGYYRSAFELYTKAAELGELDAHYSLSLMYGLGYGVEKDKGKEIHHLEVATIGGHPYARHSLGCYEWRNGNKERATKHWIIAATQGFDDSIKALMEKFRMGIFRRGFVNKDDLAAALRAHQAAVDATKSPQREAAEEYDRNRKSGVDT